MENLCQKSKVFLLFAPKVGFWCLLLKLSIHPVLGLKKRPFFAKSKISVLLVYGGGVTDLGLSPKKKVETDDNWGN